MECLELEDTVAEEIPVESFEVANVEDEAMAFRYGALVERIRPYDGEELVGKATSLSQALEQFMTRLDFLLRYEH